MVRQYREGSSFTEYRSPKDAKPHTAGLDDTAIPHMKTKITEIPLEKNLNTAINTAHVDTSLRLTRCSRHVTINIHFLLLND